MKCPLCYNDFHELSSGMKDLAKRLNRKTDEKCIHTEGDLINKIEELEKVNESFWSLLDC